MTEHLEVVTEPSRAHVLVTERLRMLVDAPRRMVTERVEVVTEPPEGGDRLFENVNRAPGVVTPRPRLVTKRPRLDRATRGW